MKPTNRRRALLKSGSVILASLFAPLNNAFATKNEAVRTSLKYQDKPGPDGKDCAGCLQFVPGKTPTSPGGCKVIAGDTEISPKGYCIAWVKKG
jgi:hypothetical protein